MRPDLERLRWEAKANLATALLLQRMAEIEALTQSLASVRAENEALNLRLKAIFSSASWRLTTPLRLGSFLRRAMAGRWF